MVILFDWCFESSLRSLWSNLIDRRKEISALEQHHKKWIYFLRVKKEKVASEMCSNKVSSFSIHVRNFRGKGKIWHNNTQQWWSEVEPGPKKRPKERALNRWQGQNSSLKPQTRSWNRMMRSYWTCRNHHQKGNWHWPETHFGRHLALLPPRWNMSTVSQIFV